MLPFFTSRARKPLIFLKRKCSRRAYLSCFRRRAIRCSFLVSLSCVVTVARVFGMYYNESSRFRCGCIAPVRVACVAVFEAPLRIASRLLSSTRSSSATVPARDTLPLKLRSDFFLSLLLLFVVICRYFEHVVGTCQHVNKYNPRTTG